MKKSAANGRVRGITIAGIRAGRGATVAALVILLTASLLGCTAQSAETASSSSTPLAATGPAPKVTNDLAKNSAHHSLKVAGEPFGLTVDYWTSYPAATWQTLQPKTVALSVHVAPAAGDQPEVLMGAFRATTTLLATMTGLNGLPVADSNELPGAVPGYLMTVNYPFDTVVPIEGYSAALVDRWQLLAGDEALTEPNLVQAGVYGNLLSFSYRILVRNTGDDGYHQRSVQDSLTVTVSPSGATKTTPGAPQSTSG